MKAALCSLFFVWTACDHAISNQYQVVAPGAYVLGLNRSNTFRWKIFIKMIEQEAAGVQGCKLSGLTNWG